MGDLGGELLPKLLGESKVSPQAECPTESKLTAFVLGELSDSEIDAISSHLEFCSSCEQTAQKLDNLADAAIDALRQSDDQASRGTATSILGKVAETTRNAAFESSAKRPAPMDDYEILEELGRGGMGVVYKAWQTSLRRTVALKMMLGSQFSDEQTRARFRSEAEAIARLQHPHIVQVFQVGEVNGVPYFSLEYVEGGSLDQHVGKPQSIDQSAVWLESLARTVHYAHQQGVVHRDLKPENMLLALDGQVKITDFGVAKLMEGSDVETASGLIVGTAEYMAPEQADARRDVGPSADVYSLGVVLYTLITGRPPFQSASVLETLEQVKFQEPVPPRRLRPLVPRDLETICLKCLQKESRNRYASAEALANDLGRFREGRPIQARRLGPALRLWRWSRQNRTVAALTVLVGALLLVVAAGATIEMRLAQKRAQAEITSREVLERQLYRTYIALAERECSANNMGQVDRLLEACRPDLRGWEWHYLKRRRFENALRLQSPAGIPVYGAAFSPDGRFLAATAPGLRFVNPPAQAMHRLIPQSQFGTITLWNLETGKEGPLLHGHSSFVWALAFRGDGGGLATAGEDGTVRIWNLETRKPRHVLDGHDGPVKAVTYHPDHRRVASGSDDGTIIIWDAESGQIGSRLAGHSGPVLAVTFSPSGEYLASCSSDKSIKIWSVENGREIRTLSDQNVLVQDVAFSSDNKRLATVGEGKVKLWSTSTGEEIAVLEGHVNEVFAVKFSPDGQRIATGGGDRTIRLWDTKTGEETLTLHGHADSVLCVDFSPDGKRLVSTGRGGRILVWDATPIEESPLREPPTLQGHSASVECVAFSPDGRQLASASLDGTVIIWDRETLQKIHTLRSNSEPVSSLAFHPDGRQLVSLDAKGGVTVWDVSAGTEELVLEAHSAPGTCVKFHPDGALLASASRSGNVKLWNLKTGKLVREFQAQSRWVNGLAFDRKGNRLATANDNGTIQIWEVATGKELHVLGRSSLAVTAVAFSPDGVSIAGSSRDETIKIWDLETGRVSFLLEGHTNRVHGISFSPDGERIASVSGDETVRIWDVRSGRQMRVLRGHRDVVKSVAFHSDGQWLATGSRDRSVKIWKLSGE